MTEDDKHLNLYYSYDMVDKKSGNGQLEDNVTRALCICLKNSKNARDVFFSIIKQSINNTDELKFDLQNKNKEITEIINNKNKRILLGIVPDGKNTKEHKDPYGFETLKEKLENITEENKKNKFCKDILEEIEKKLDNDEKTVKLEITDKKSINLKKDDLETYKNYLEDVMNNRYSRLDAWIYIKNKWIIAIENKLYCGITHSQWERHRNDLKGTTNTLKEETITWKEIYEGINKKREENKINNDIFLTDFIKYMEMLNLAGFRGLKDIDTKTKREITLKLLVDEIKDEITEYYQNKAGIKFFKKETRGKNWIVFYDNNNDFRKGTQIGICIERESLNIYLLISNKHKTCWDNLKDNNYIETIIEKISNIYKKEPIPYAEFTIYQRHGTGAPKLYRVTDSEFKINLELLIKKDKNQKLKKGKIKRETRVNHIKILNNYIELHEKEKKNANIEFSINTKFFLDSESDEYKETEEYLEGIDPTDVKIKNTVIKIIKDMLPLFKLLSDDSK
ncbi:MAG: hypothetical protein KAS90_00205 [Candidatus Aenigmarchaeota archaeon]|nr:hypothetical protein [Candidatus Aenigmarchaeota archaeon]